jgi:hypothetical protein
MKLKCAKYGKWYEELNYLRFLVNINLLLLDYLNL